MLRCVPTRLFDSVTPACCMKWHTGAAWFSVKYGCCGGEPSLWRHCGISVWKGLWVCVCVCMCLCIFSNSGISMLLCCLCLFRYVNDNKRDSQDSCLTVGVAEGIIKNIPKVGNWPSTVSDWDVDTTALYLKVKIVSLVQEEILQCDILPQTCQ